MDPFNIKAWFRRAQANVSLTDFTDAIVDLRAVLDVDPMNIPAKRLLCQARAAWKESNMER